MARLAHAAPPSLEESMNLMEELCRLYSCDDDKNKVLELRTARAHIDAVLRQREDHMAQILHEMTQRVAAAEAKAVPPISEAEHAARVAAVEADRSRAVAQLEELTQEAGQLNSEQAALGQRQHALAAQRQQADENTRKTETELRQHLQLYKLLTGVSWDTAHIQGGRVKGHVLDTAHADVRPFDLDATSMDAVTVADELWAQVAAF